METSDEYTGIEAQNDPEFAMEGWTEEEYEEQINKLKIYNNENIQHIKGDDGV